MSESTESQLKERFANAAPNLEADVLNELQSIMRLHSLDVEELWYKWESYNIKMGLDDMKLTIDTTRALKKDIQDGLERENRAKVNTFNAHKKVAGTPRGGANSSDVFGMLDGLAPKTPKVRTGGSAAKRKLETPHSRPSPGEFKTPLKPGEAAESVLSFHDRENAGQTLEVLNEHIELPEHPLAPFPESRIKLTASSDLKKLSYKTLAMKASEASEILDERIDEFTALIQAHHKLDDSAFGSAANQSTNEIIAVGRIASDSLDGRLNASSIVLETSRRMGAGLRIPLTFPSIRNFQFFPGQVVALRGINASGESFTVSDILEMPLLPSAASPSPALSTHLERLRGGPDAMDTDSLPPPLSLLLASGPYTGDDNLDFEPLHELCSQAANTYVDTLLMNGPFIDVDHPLIAIGDFDLPEDVEQLESETATMATVFKHFISPALTQLTNANPSITILLVPSVKDFISKHVSWPQEPYPRKDLGLPKSVRIVGNPMTLSLNEISLGVSSQDILSELKTAEVVAGTAKDNTALSRLPRYLIEQRNFFPLFPPLDRDRLPKTRAADSRPVGSMLDVSYLKLGDMINVKPDMLVVPSALPPFAKIVESVLVVNPGFVSRRRGPSTYAKVTVIPRLVDEEEKESTMLAHKLYERARVDIVRI